MRGKMRLMGATRLFFSLNTNTRTRTRLPRTSVSTSGSYIQYCAASVPSDHVPHAYSSSRTKVSKAQRRAMVESFVNNYRAMNGGKFPSIMDTRKHVGGSHYLLRQIIQELEYKSKLYPLLSESEHLSGKQLTDENESLTEVEDVSGNRIAYSSEIQNDSEMLSISELGIGNHSSKHLEGELLSSVSADNSLAQDPVQPSIKDDHSGFLTTESEVWEGDAKEVSEHVLEKPDDDRKVEARGDSGFVSVESNILNEEYPSLEKREEAHSHSLNNTEYKLQEKKVSEVLMDVEGTKSKPVPEPKRHARDTCRRQSDTELPRKSSLWGNLKSFADSIVSMWRKW